MKFVPIVLIGFALTVQAQGYISTKRVSLTPSVPVVVTHDYPVIRVSGKIAVDPFVAENVIEDSSTLECWMFQEEYLDVVNPFVIEGWMLAEQYLSTENVPIENWMKDPGYLSN